MIEIMVTVLEQIVLYLPLMMGAYIVFSLMKVPHLSIETAYVGGAIVASKILAYTHTTIHIMNLVCVCIASMLGGILSGCIVAFLGLKGKIPYFLANILTIGLCYGFNLFILGGSNVSLTTYENPLLINIPHNHPELIITLMISVIILVIIMLFFKTPLGICLAIYGNNALFFQHYGISTFFVVSCGFMLANALAGLSGYLVAQSSGFVDVNAGTGISLFCITALVLGNVVVRSHHKIISALIPTVGLSIYCILQQLLLKIGFNAKYFSVLHALIVSGVLIIHCRNRVLHDKDDLGV